VVILDDEGRLQRVVAAHDVGRAINPRLCAEQMEAACTWAWLRPLGELPDDQRPADS